MLFGGQRRDFGLFEGVEDVVNEEASAARLATCMECWKVPGTVSDICRKRSLLIFESSTKVTLEVNPKVFSNKNNKG